jgi:hypothetical protein
VIPERDGYAGVLDGGRGAAMMLQHAEASLNIIRNEQTKLTATAMNNTAVAVIITGFLGPIFALRSGTETAEADAISITVSIVWLLLGFILHFLARLTLLGLKA